MTTDQQRQANADAVAGKAQRMSPDDAYQAMLAQTRITDPVAYAAALPLMTPKTMTVPMALL